MEPTKTLRIVIVLIQKGLWKEFADFTKWRRSLVETTPASFVYKSIAKGQFFDPTSLMCTEVQTVWQGRRLLFSVPSYSRFRNTALIVHYVIFLTEKGKKKGAPVVPTSFWNRR